VATTNNDPLLCPACTKDPDPRDWSACYDCRELHRNDSVRKIRPVLSNLEQLALTWAQAERLRDDRAASLTRAEEEASLRKLSQRQVCGDLTERDCALLTTLAKETEAWRQADEQEQACDHALKEAARKLLDSK
jgi:hypothetical protein